MVLLHTQQSSCSSSSLHSFSYIYGLCNSQFCSFISLRFHCHIKVILQLLSVFPFSYTNECKWRSSLFQNCQDIENSMSKRDIFMANFVSIVLVRPLLYTAYKYNVTAVEYVHTDTIHYGLDTITDSIFIISRAAFWNCLKHMRRWVTRFSSYE